MTADPMLARVHIEDTIARYNIAGDRRDLEAFVGTFCEDAVYEPAVFSCRGSNQR